jgi:hypothetical protein
MKIDFEKMKEICLAKKDYFENYGHRWYTDAKDFYFYQDNGADVLAVAHIDSVHSEPHFHVIKVKDEVRVICSTLDDRLGAYIILDLLPRHGMKYDILLTDQEETGNSTAGIFNCPEGKHYKWMFSFDRHGNDVVHYQYSDIRPFLQDAGFGYNEIQHGAFSDIGKLEDLGCLGANFGTGYHDEHTVWAYANMSEMVSNVRRFTTFYHKFRGQHLKKEEPKPIVVSHSKDWRPNYHYNTYYIGSHWDVEEKVYYPNESDGKHWDFNLQRYITDATTPDEHSSREGYWLYENGKKTWCTYTTKLAPRHIEKPVDRKYADWETCEGCQKVLSKSELDEPQIWGYCDECSKKRNTCSCCYEVYEMKAGVDDWNLCPKCTQDVQDGNSKRTSEQCPVCGNFYMSADLLDGIGCKFFKLHEEIEKRIKPPVQLPIRGLIGRGHII